MALVLLLTLSKSGVGSWSCCGDTEANHRIPGNDGSLWIVLVCSCFPRFDLQGFTGRPEFGQLELIGDVPRDEGKRDVVLGEKLDLISNSNTTFTAHLEGYSVHANPIKGLKMAFCFRADGVQV